MFLKKILPLKFKQYIHTFLNCEKVDLPVRKRAFIFLAADYGNIGDLAISAADFIITDSFHGTVFSIIFNKPFISIVNKERGASRFNSFLSQLNLTSRMVSDIGDINDNLINSKIDYNNINNKIIELRGKSLDYLENSLF